MPNMKPFTVLLLYPDYISNDFGHETYLAHVMAEGRHFALALAKCVLQGILADNDGHEDDLTPLEDFQCLALFEGHLVDIKP